MRHDDINPSREMGGTRSSATDEAGPRKDHASIIGLCRCSLLGVLRNSS